MNKTNVIFLTDLEHSAPRISNFITNVKNNSNYKVSIIGSNYSEKLSSNDLPNDFEKNIQLFLFKRNFDLVYLLSNLYKNFFFKHKYNHKHNHDINNNYIELKYINSIAYKFKKRFIIFFLSLYLPDQYIIQLYKYYNSFKVNFKNSSDKVILISSSPYPTTHIACSIIKNNFPNINIFWIADYRDLWSLNHNYQFSNFRNILDSKIEKFFLKNTDLITTVSQPWSDKISFFLNKKSIVIPNGYSNIETITTAKIIKEKSDFTYFLHVGSIYYKKQDINFLFKSLSILSSNHQNLKIELHFSGEYSEQLETLIKKYNINHFVKQIGKYTRNDSIAIQREYDFLFYFDWIDDEGVLPLKFYEYIYANKPIISIGYSPESSTGKILTKLNRGVYLKTEEEIFLFFKDIEFRKKIINNLSFNQNSNKEYSFTHQSNLFLNILNDITNGRLSKSI